MSKTQSPPKKSKVAAGAVGFVIAILILYAIGSVLNDSQQPEQPYGIVMGIMWASAFFSFFVMWMLYFSYFILPGSDHAQWNRGHRLLWRYYIHQSSTYLSHLSAQLRTRKKERKRRSVQEEAPPSPTYEDSFKRIGASIVPTHIVLSLDHTSRKARPFYKTIHGQSVGFSRAAGPGIVILNGNFIRKTEKITHKIDLRPQLRKVPVDAMTSDGIEIKTTVIVIFHVSRAKSTKNTQNNQAGNGSDTEDKEHYALYHYDEKDIKLLRYAYKDNWHATVAPRAATLLAEELSTYTLEQLHDANGIILQKLRDTVKARLDAQLNTTTTVDEDGNKHVERKNSGITIMAVNLFSIEEPDHIQEQRLALWEMEIEEKINVLKLEQQANSARNAQDMRATAQIDIVNNIIDSIQAMYDAENITLSEIITLRMVTALEEAMKNEAVMMMTPQMLTYWITDTIKQMQSLLDEE